MGDYINRTKKGNLGATFTDKVNGMIADGAEKVSSDKYIEDMVCVVNNGMFAAAAYLYSEQEYLDFKEDCGREKVFLKYPNVKEVIG